MIFILSAVLIFHAARAANPALDALWARAAAAPPCPHGPDLERLPPETAMKTLEALTFLTAEEASLLRRASADRFGDVFLHAKSVDKMDCAEARLRLGKAVRRGPKALAPRLLAVLERPKTPPLINLVVDLVTFHQGLREKFFDAPKDVAKEVLALRMDTKREIDELNAGFEKFRDEDLMAWEPTPDAVAKFKALPDFESFKTIVLREQTYTAQKTDEFRRLLARTEPVDFESIWRRVREANHDLNPKELDPPPPEEALRQLERIPVLTSVEIEVAKRALAEDFASNFPKWLDVVAAETSQRLKYARAVLKGPPALASRLHAILARSRAPTRLGLMIDILTLQEAVESGFFKSSRALKSDVARFRADIKTRTATLDADAKLFEDEGFAELRPSPEMTRRLRASKNLPRLRDAIFREWDLVEKSSADFKKLLERGRP